MPYDSPPDLLARPNQRLQDHLDGVTRNAQRLVPSDATLPSGDSLQEVVTTVAALHDIGKLTQWFQEYIHEDDTCSKPSKYKRHSLLGAYLTWQALNAIDVSDDTKLAGFYAVAKHHGVLPDFDENTLKKYALSSKPSCKTRIDRVQKQLANIDTHASSIADGILQNATDSRLSWEHVLVDRTEGYTQGIDACWPPDNQSDFYTMVLRIWSTLTCADKLDAGGVTVSEGSPKTPDPRLIDDHLDTDAEGLLETLNEYRTTARKDATERLATLDDSVYTLTLPTGFGKTLAGLESALAEAERTGGRVVYALPFTTVVDQVHDEVTEKLEVSPDRESYTLHYHLADTRTKVDPDDETVSDGSEVLYGESWQAGLVLTTFVQLFESLAGPENTQSIKLPALQDSVVVVDEPQALTRKWWYLVSRLTSVLVDEYDATVILMTATQPGIIAETNPTLDPTELIREPESYFQFLEDHQRVRFEVEESVREHVVSGRRDGIAPTTAGNRLYESTASQQVDSVLAVSNTVRAATAVYRSTAEAVERADGTVVSLGTAVGAYRDDGRLLEAVDSGDEILDTLVSEFIDDLARRAGEDDVLLAALSTAIRPVDRAFLIQVLRRLVGDHAETPLDDHRLIVSSTQLVEAGVDISFDCLFRDYAPVPSLVQAAGRCNRSFGGGTATVTLWRLDGIGDAPPPSAIYERKENLLRPTGYALRSMLDDHGPTIPEHVMVSDGVEAYYEQLHSDDNRSVDTDSLAAAVDNAEGETLREATLIEDDSEDVIVLTGEADAALLREYIESRARGNYDAASDAFDSLKYLSASVREVVTDDTEAFVASETAVDSDQLDLSELVVTDARPTDAYHLHDGSGLRPLD